MALNTDNDPLGPGPSPSAGRDDIDVRAVTMFVVGLFATVAAVAAVVWVLFGYFADREQATDVQPRAVSAGAQRPPEPRLQVLTAPDRGNPGLGMSSQQDLESQRRAENEILTSYGWVDRNANIVHVPIERAMELYLERGSMPSESEAPSVAEGEASVPTGGQP